MKKTILGILFLGLILNMKSQIIVEIDSIYLSNVITKVKHKCNNLFQENLYDGPIADIYISFVNTTDTIIYLDFYRDFGYFYGIDGVEHKNETDYPLCLDENRLILRANDKQFFCFANEPLYYYKSKNDDKLDFLLEIIEIIPTLRFFIQYSESTIIISDKCRKVIIADTYSNNCVIYNYKMEKTKKKLSKVINVL